MKKWLAIGSLVLLGLFVLFTAACCVMPLTEWAHPSEVQLFKQPCDFNLRYNEMQCVRGGVDPFDVWKEKVDCAPYMPMGSLYRGKYNAPVNGYTPWAYMMALPVSFLPPQSAWGFYVAFMFVCLGLLAWGGYDIGYEASCDKLSAVLFATIPILTVAYPIWSNFCIGNYAVPILAAIFMMCWCLNRGYDVWAGVFWAMAMIKPQNSLLLAVPLLMRGKFRVCFVATAICVALTVPSAIICRKSLLTLILQIPSVGSGAFFGCATMPSYVRELIGTTPALIVAATIGLTICTWLTARMRNAKSWILYAMPAVMCSISWTYTTSYSYALSWFLVVAIMLRLVFDRSIGMITIAFCAAILLPRFYTCLYGASNAFGLFKITPSTNHAIDTSISLAVLLLTIIFVLFMGSRNGNQIPRS